MEFNASTVKTEHKDIIHDISCDFYGKRMCTCSTDQSVKVWDLDESGCWVMTASWKAHSGSVWKVTWAHPEFGQVIATCSFDRTAAVWEEIVSSSSMGGMGMMAMMGGGMAIGSSGGEGSTHWIKRTSLVDSRTSVTDVKFAPKHLGLLLATCSADGIVRIYEAPDVMNLSQWSLQHEVSCKAPCSCLSWNPSLHRLHLPMIAVASDDSSTSSSSSSGSGAGGGGSSGAGGTGAGKVFIYEYGENTRRWSRVETLGFVTDPVHDLAFAPNLGRSFHILAIATAKDLKIVTIKPLQLEPGSIGSAGGSHSRFEIRPVGQFTEHGGSVWRVTWNIAGTILISSGDEGCVRLWKGTSADSWKCVATLRSDGSSAGGNEEGSGGWFGGDSGNASGGPSSVAQPSNQVPAGALLPPGSARYYKLGSVGNPNQVPWH